MNKLKLLLLSLLFFTGCTYYNTHLKSSSVSSRPAKEFRKVAVQIVSVQKGIASSAEFQFRDIAATYGLYVTPASEIASPAEGLSQEEFYRRLSKKGFDGLLVISSESTRQRLVYSQPPMIETRYRRTYRGGHQRYTYVTPGYNDYSYDKPHEIAFYAVPSMKLVWVASGETSGTDDYDSSRSEAYLNSLAKEISNKLHHDGIVR